MLRSIKDFYNGLNESWQQTINLHDKLEQATNPQLIKQHLIEQHTKPNASTAYHLGAATNLLAANLTKHNPQLIKHANDIQDYYKQARQARKQQTQPPHKLLSDIRKHEYRTHKPR